MASYNQDENNDWLNLKLGRNEEHLSGDKSFLSSPSSPKIFSCNFCGRRFYNSQALGGHQNAHRNEKKTLQRRQSGLLMTIADSISINKQVIRSLGIQHKPSISRKPAVARSNNIREGNWFERSKLLSEEISNKWLGSYHISPKVPKVDLTLRL